MVVRITEIEIQGTPPQWAGDLTEREQAEIRFARIYAKHFGHGTVGHSEKLLLTKLADKLDKLEGYNQSTPLPEATI